MARFSKLVHKRVILDWLPVEFYRVVIQHVIQKSISPKSDPHFFVWPFFSVADGDTLVTGPEGWDFMVF